MLLIMKNKPLVSITYQTPESEAAGVTLSDVAARVYPGEVEGVDFHFVDDSKLPGVHTWRDSWIWQSGPNEMQYLMERAKVIAIQLSKQNFSIKYPDLASFIGNQVTATADQSTLASVISAINGLSGANIRNLNWITNTLEPMVWVG